jgi:hypothetical protein
MKNIYEVLRHKELQVQQLKQEIEALKIAAKLITDEQDSPPRTNGQISQPEMMRAVLLESIEPMHVAKIGEAIQRKFKKKIKPVHLSAIIYRHIKSGKSFFKVENKPNTFGLLEKHRRSDSA